MPILKLPLPASVSVPFMVKEDRLEHRETAPEPFILMLHDVVEGIDPDVALKLPLPVRVSVVVGSK